ncbi:hypothetical protein JOC54_003226 [Alkalihalobacillus xiaoxiensis]|uniref:Uncharacterized protein n=1 Tax=Shouchella xiaoxiensis TaxID=766895 RepID=A0ABS2SWN9_9BACI|nr:hypothetical protein [Shouchella xiaoxiensis]MBM7839946.1 hypothetical protein [Shouchella xiaoxiensis]
MKQDMNEGEDYSYILVASIASPSRNGGDLQVTLSSAGLPVPILSDFRMNLVQG